MKKDKQQWYIAIMGVCILLGTIIGIQYNTVKKQAAAIEMQRVTELSNALKKMQDENEKLSKQLAEDEKKLREYEGLLANEGDAMKTLKKELDQVRNYAGMTKLQGRGVEITLKDSSMAAQSGGDINAYLVHAEDILSILNELNVAGAEAISINGQRIVSNSSVRCAGSVVNVNGVKIAAPFVISAIGNADILEAALVFPGGVVDSLSPWGIEITIKKQEHIVIPAYTLPRQMIEASPVEEGGNGA
ncbi:MAG: DUF881 domain-containing protein [Epulopiscium sp.]|nr:DUF881 domain-containing protein [Candidatus Epulonipiscium sp.]